MLLAARNPDGGWGYAPAKASRLEPTCWSVLALAATDASVADPGILKAWPRTGGRFIDGPGLPPNNAFNALAVITLLQDERTASLAPPIVRSLVASQSVKLQQADVVRQDNSLRAWPWIDDTASWVEPTAWCLLALKLALKRWALEGARERIDVGERMLIDRACRPGGWNYGNSAVYGQELWPYVPTTAIALLALQDRRSHPVVQAGLQVLPSDAPSERSALAMSFALICARIYGWPAELWERGLVAVLSGPQREALHASNVLALATTLCALDDSRAVTALKI